MGGGGGVVAHEILVSAQGPFLGFWVWGLGLTINYVQIFVIMNFQLDQMQAWEL